MSSVQNGVKAHEAVSLATKKPIFWSLSRLSVRQILHFPCVVARDLRRFLSNLGNLPYFYGHLQAVLSFLEAEFNLR